MTATADKRKRFRDDELCDSMPLSKRINNLHLNSFVQQNQHNSAAPATSSSDFDSSSMEYYNNNPDPHLQVPHDDKNRRSSSIGNTQNHDSTISQELLINDSQQRQQNGQHHPNAEQHDLPCGRIENYSPQLNQHENPYYYNKNKLLYELHAERLRRVADGAGAQQ